MTDFTNLKKIQKKNHPELPIIKVALLGDTATQFLAVALRGIGIERGYNLNLFEADYNQIDRQLYDPSSDYHQFEPQYTIIFHSTHKLLEQYSLKASAEWNTIADERLSTIQSYLSNVDGKIIYFNYPEIDDTVFGQYANRTELSFIWQVRKLNYDLMQLTQEFSNLFICDIAALQNKFGRDWMFDSSVYVSTEMVLSLDALPYVASRVMDIVCANEGKFHKCLILDLDNTVWGGIIGDDGWENIQVGHGLGIGKAFSEFQEWIKKLKNRGIIVAICSKNDEDKAKEPFEKNPEMILRLEDIAVFIANWDNKADNIRTIQKILNIGFDSMVFLDDNPAERAIVRDNIPAICVPELPEDPGDYLEYLYSLNLFETLSFSSGDKDRTKQYQTETKRIKASQKYTNEADFLKSLNMLSRVEGFTDFNIPRVAQLSQRSNQFNLRTVRYTDGEIALLASSEKHACFSFTLEDKFGDNGLICVIILEKQDNKTLFINSWFMSCRVLKRGMENFALNIIVEYAKKEGFLRIIGEYIPTLKNNMVCEHYPNLGFQSIQNNLYELDINTYVPRECYIQKKR